MSPEKFRSKLLFFSNSRRVNSHLSVPVVKARFPLVYCSELLVSFGGDTEETLETLNEDAVTPHPLLAVSFSVCLQLWAACEAGQLGVPAMWKPALAISPHPADLHSAPTNAASERATGHSLFP